MKADRHPREAMVAPAAVPGVPERDSAPAEDGHRLAAAYLSRVAEPGCLGLWQLVAECGYAEAASRVRAGAVSPEVRSATVARAEDLDPLVDLEVADQLGIRLITPSDSEWPLFALAPLYRTVERLSDQSTARPSGRADRGGSAARAGGLAEARAELPVPPLALWVKGQGDLAELSVRSLAIVGARAATAYGQHVAAEFGYGVAAAEITVVSGGAFGIDAAAHRGALAAGGPAVLVSAGGLDRPYPAAHSRLFAQVAESGLLVSERPPGSAPQRQRFLQRNRLIAALASATLVVEAARRSGALNTARHARRLGRPVLGTPGPITSALSLGVHDLLSRADNPARLVSTVSEAVTWTAGGGSEATADVAEESHRRPLDGLSEQARQAYDGLPARAPASTARIAKRAGMAPEDVQACLAELESAGLVILEDDGTVRRSGQ